MSGTLGFPFTMAQWKELQRQAMIYKYMMASVPVPPDLLSPLARTFSLDHSQSHLNGSMFNVRFPCNNKDAEPGRCKRTDGKKWRCSRDVAPQQKYCERHMNRGRPRSRKHVEVHAPPFTTTTTTAVSAMKKTRHQLNPIPRTPMAAVSELDHVLRSTIQPNENNHLPDKNTRSGLDWGTTLYTSDQQWQQMIQTNIGLTTNGSIYKEESMIPNLVFGVPVIDPHNNQCALCPKTDFVSLENEIQTERTPLIGFIDAWTNESMDFKNESSVSSQGNLSPSLTLSMAMAAGNVLDEEMCNIQMGSGKNGGTHTSSTITEKHPHGSRWLNHNVSWMCSGSGPGGPLAEALGPNPLAKGSSPASSPSGVLHRTMVSLSDSSGCNSPTTLAGSMAVPETKGFQFMN